MLNKIVADLAWWFGWSPGEILDMTLDDLAVWHDQAKRQIESGYSKAAV